MSHGQGLENIYHWNHTVGPLESRKPDFNIWNYHQTRGLGFFEYFQFCEDIGAEPLPVLAAGVPCQNSANNAEGIGGQQGGIPMADMPAYVEEICNLIEWANGDPATNEWAKMRAEAGHPKPFNLKYLGIGNEEKISPEFIERFKYIYERVTKAHPEIVIVGTDGPGSHKDNPDYEAGWKLADEIGMPITDEHYYEPRDYFLNKRQYDNYPRDRKTKVYLGEYAAKDKKLIDALAEGLYLLHVERNADVVTMTSYAPLLAKKDGTQWNPDLIYFDNERTYPTCSYYVQQMFGQSAGNYYYGDCVKFEGDAADAIQPMEGVHYGQSVILNTKTRQLFVKLVNASADAKKANINLSRFGIKKLATKTTLAGQPNDENNFDAQPIAPKKEQIKAQKKFALDLAPYSMVMLQYQL
jgi:alpha-L-arabinofuranosidase